VTVAVQRDFMAGCGDLGSHRGKALDLLTDEEEGRNDPAPVQVLEHCWRAGWVWTVVEGERDPPRAPEADANAQRPRSRRCDRR